MVLPKQLIKKYEEIFSVSPKSIPSLDQIILTKFIESGKYANHINRLRTSFLNKKKLILNILSNTKIEIVSTNNYSSILVKMDKSINIDKLKKEFKNKKIKISFINDFMEKKVDDEILIIGFSSIDINIIDKGINLIIDSINNCLN
jgi:GntR family transcriptional regulator/MocR family aminotransferase